MDSNATQGVLTLIVKAFQKIGLALLFFFLGITWILINPLIVLASAGEFFRDGNTPWNSVGGLTWVMSLVYIAIGVMLLLRKYKPSIKIPEIVYTISFGALALFSLIDLINLGNTFAHGDVLKYFNDLPQEFQLYIVMSYVYSILTLIAFAGVVAFMFMKDKVKKYFWAPGGVMVLATLCLAIGTLAYAVKFVDSIHPAQKPEMVFGIIFGLILGLAMLFFCYFFVALAPATEKPATETAEQTEEDVQIDLNSMGSVTATPAKSEPQLTAAQKEELANAQELFELGAYSEEEFEAEKQRIIYGL